MRWVCLLWAVILRVELLQIKYLPTGQHICSLINWGSKHRFIFPFPPTVCTIRFRPDSKSGPNKNLGMAFGGYTCLAFVHLEWSPNFLSLIISTLREDNQFLYRSFHLLDVVSFFVVSFLLFLFDSKWELGLIQFVFGKNMSQIFSNTFFR